MVDLLYKYNVKYTLCEQQHFCSERRYSLITRPCHFTLNYK